MNYESNNKVVIYHYYSFDVEIEAEAVVTVAGCSFSLSKAG